LNTTKGVDRKKKKEVLGKKKKGRGTFAKSAAHNKGKETTGEPKGQSRSKSGNATSPPGTGGKKFLTRGDLNVQTARRTWEILNKKRIIGGVQGNTKKHGKRRRQSW